MTLKTDFGISESGVGTILIFMSKCSPEPVDFKNVFSFSGGFF